MQFYKRTELCFSVVIRLQSKCVCVCVVVGLADNNTLSWLRITDTLFSSLLF